MIKKRIGDLFRHITGKDENFPLEHRLLLSSLLVGGLVSVFGSIINLVLTTSLFAVLLPLFLFGFVLILFYFIRFRKVVEPVIIPILIVSITGISAIWVLNGGINGANIMPAFVILILGLIVAPERSKKFILTYFLAANIIILVVQLYRPDLIVPFPTEKARWIDNILTLLYSSYLIFVIISFFHKEYSFERNKAEDSEKKLRQLNEDKDRFISILGHDLRSPFNNLLGFSEILAEDARSLNQDEITIIAEKINISAKNVYKLLDDMLLWARAQQDKIPFRPNPLRIENICNEVIELLGPGANAKGISLNYSGASDDMVFADEEMLKTILRNLMGNAIKYTNTGGSVIVTAEKKAEGTIIRVSDNGIGISREDIGRLFNISVIISSKGTADETGTGLGLLICNDFIQKHNGSIRVESEPGKGSSFIFLLPHQTLL